MNNLFSCGRGNLEDKIDEKERTTMKPPHNRKSGSPETFTQLEGTSGSSENERGKSFSSGVLQNRQRQNSNQRDEELKILLIGKTGNGKSSTGNGLLALSEPPFEVSTGILSATEHTQMAESVRERGTRKLKVQVIDFPDVTCDMTEEKVREEVDLCKTLTFPYPSAVCMVVRSDVRFTPEEYASYQKTRELLSKLVSYNLIVVFTMADKLPADQRTKFDEQLQQANEQLKTVLKEADGRYVLFSNAQDKESVPGNAVDGSEKTKDIDKLFEFILNLHDMPSRTRRLRVVLVGSSGGGKSATGNTLLHPNPEFKVQSGFTSGTNSCDKAISNLRGFELELLDTPELDQSNIGTSVNDWFSALDPGPDVILYVTKVGVRFREREFLTLAEVIGGDFTKHVIIIFTHGDELKKRNATIEDELSHASESLKDIMSRVQNRYIVVDNTTDSATEKSLQRNRLLRLIVVLQGKNGNKPLKRNVGVQRRNSYERATGTDYGKPQTESSRGYLDRCAIS